MKTIHGLLAALTALKPSHNQLLLVSSFYEDAELLRIFVNVSDQYGCPHFSLQNDQCGIKVKLMLGNSEQAHAVPESAMLLSPEDSQKLREFIQDDIQGMKYFACIVKALNNFPIETVTKWVTVSEHATVLHFGVDGRVLIEIELDSSLALTAVAKKTKTSTWPFNAKSYQPSEQAANFYLQKNTRMLAEAQPA